MKIVEMVIPDFTDDTLKFSADGSVGDTNNTFVFGHRLS
jgi:hypothetical protein